MLDSQMQSQIDAATAYEQLFVPALFAPWAAHVAALARIRQDERVLDVACGTGVLAREAASRAGGGGFVAGIDPNPGMLEVARQLAPDVEWRQGMAESLPYPDEHFDVVVSQFGLMFFQNRHEAVREMLRVLTPGGRLVVAVWDSLESNPAYALEVQLVERMAGTAAAEALRAPFVLGDRNALATLFTTDGADSIEVASHPVTAEFPGVRVMVEADLRGWLPVMGVILSDEVIESILEEAVTVLERYVTSDGTVAFDSRALIVTGHRARS